MTDHILPANITAFLARQHKLLIGGEWVDGSDSPIDV